MYRRQATTAAIAGLFVFSSAGGAYAYWTVTGSGSSTATVATIKPLVVTPVDITDMVLGKAVPLTGEVRNPNDFEANLAGTVFTVTATVDREHNLCAPTSFEIVVPSTKAKSIPANGTVEFDKGTITMLDTDSDQAACQGAILTLDYLLK